MSDREGLGVGVMAVVWLASSVTLVVFASDPPSRPEISIQVGHEGGIRAVSWSPDGRFVATGGHDGSVRLWDAETGMLSRIFLGHAGALTLVRFSADGRLLVSHGTDGRLRIVDARSGELQRTFSARQAAQSHDARRLAWTNDANEVRSWVLGSGAEPRLLGAFKEKAWNFSLEVWEPARIVRLEVSPDGRLVAGASSSGTLRVWDADQARQLRSFEGHVGEDVWFALQPASDTLISVGDVVKPECPCPSPMPNMCRYQSSGEKSPGRHLHFWDTVPALQLWDGRTGRVVRSIEAQDAPPVLSAFAASPDGRFVAGRGRDKRLRVWDARTGALSWNTAADELFEIQFSGDGQALVGRMREGIRLWDSVTGEPVRELGSDCTRINDRWAFSSDGRRVACGTQDGWVSASSAQTGQRSWLAEPPTQKVDAVALGADGRFLAAGTWHELRSVRLPGLDHSTRHAIQLFDLESGQLLRAFAGEGFSLALSPDGRYVSVGMGLQEAATGKRQNELYVPVFARAGSVSFSADGSLMVAASALSRSSFGTDRGFGAERGPGSLLRPQADQQLRVWNTRTGRIVLSEPKDSLRHRIDVLAAAVTPDGRLAMGAFDNDVHVYEIATGALVRTLPGPQESFDPWGVTAMAASPDNRSLVVSHGRMLRLWNAQTGVLERSIEAVARSDAAGRVDHVLSVAFSPDGQRIAAAIKDSTIRIWDRTSGARLAVLQGHAGAVTDLAYAADGQRLVSGGDDGTLRFWDASTGEARAVLFSQPATGDWAVVTPDGLFDGTERGIAKLVGWRFADNQTAPLELFFSEFYSPGLLAAVARGEKQPAPRDIGVLDRRQPRLALALHGPSALPDRAGQAAASGPARVATRLVDLKLEVAESAAGAEHSAGSGARDVRLFRNGSLVRVWRGDVHGGRPSVTLEAQVPIVAGDNRFTAYAFNRDNIKSADAELLVVGDKSLARQGTAWVLAIGIDRYQNPDYDLKYAAADATLFAETLREQQARLGAYASVEVIPLLDSDATKANILDALGRLSGRVAPGSTAGTGSSPRAALARLRRAEPEDVVLAYYAGHGTASESSFYLIPHDLGYAGRRAGLDAAGLKAILEHAVSDRELEQAFEGIDAGRLLLVIDACNSGQALEAEEKRRGPMNSKGLAQLAYEKGMYVLTASQGYQAALEVQQLGHGLLTYALVEEGLKSAAADASPKDGRVVLREWLDFATQRVPQLQGQAMRQARAQGRELSFVTGEETLATLEERSLQRPRVFYRREPEREPFVVGQARAAR